MFDALTFEIMGGVVSTTRHTPNAHPLGQVIFSVFIKPSALHYHSETHAGCPLMLPQESILVREVLGEVLSGPTVVPLTYKSFPPSESVQAVATACACVVALTELLSAEVFPRAS